MRGRGAAGAVRGRAGPWLPSCPAAGGGARRRVPAVCPPAAAPVGRAPPRGSAVPAVPSSVPAGVCARHPHPLHLCERRRRQPAALQHPAPPGARPCGTAAMLPGGPAGGSGTSAGTGQPCAGAAPRGPALPAVCRGWGEGCSPTCLPPAGGRARRGLVLRGTPEPRWVCAGSRPAGVGLVARGSLASLGHRPGGCTWCLAGAALQPRRGRIITRHCACGHAARAEEGGGEGGIL